MHTWMHSKRMLLPRRRRLRMLGFTCGCINWVRCSMKLSSISKTSKSPMKYLAVVLALVILAQAAVIPENFRNSNNLIHRSILFPLDPEPQGPGNVASFEALTHPFSTYDILGNELSQQSERIVGGSEARPHQFPWQVGIFFDNSYFCGGSMISDEYILTAAHCADGLAPFEVVIGALSEENQVRNTAANFAMYPNSRKLKNNVALIKLSTPVSFTREIAPISLASATEPDHVNDILLVIRSAKTEDSVLKSISPTLNNVTASGIPTAECVAIYGDIINNDNMLCINTIGDPGFCNGIFPGSPVLFDNNGVPILVGIVSNFGCTEGLPLVYIPLSSYAQWISDITGLII